MQTNQAAHEFSNDRLDLALIEFKSISNYPIIQTNNISSIDMLNSKTRRVLSSSAYVCVH